ncbi:MAG: M20/M25/M40 family metallo-hydrolase [Solirubrobacterales bacterium]
MAGLNNEWVVSAAAAAAGRVQSELGSLVAVSSPSGDRGGAEKVVAVAAEMLPDSAAVERPACSSADHAPDLLARLAGSGDGRVLLLGHLDTVVSHAEHRALERDGERLVGSGSIDMKGGVAISLAVLRALVDEPDAFSELALLLVNDEEWRTGGFAHGPEFAGWDACLCFEAGEVGPAGEDAVVVGRKAAGTLRVRTSGRAAHSGANPSDGKSALMPLADTARQIAALNDPDGPARLSATPTVIHSGFAFNVVPAAGELICDLRADELAAFDPVLAAVGAGEDGVRIDAELVRRWPGMDTRVVASPLLERTGALLGRPVLASERGGASDASHMAEHVELTVDGLGPLGAEAHAPGEHVLSDSLLRRTELALAMTAAALQT